LRTPAHTGFCSPDPKCLHKQGIRKQLVSQVDFTWAEAHTVQTLAQPALQARQTSSKPLCSRAQWVTDGNQPASIHQRSHADFQQLAIWPHMSLVTSHTAQITNSHSKRLMNSGPQITHANDPGITSVCEQRAQLQLLAQLTTEPQSPCETTRPVKTSAGQSH